MINRYKTINKIRLVKNWIESKILAEFENTKYKQLKNYCMFIGYGRSGHSLIGSLIDAHRNALISHEMDVLKYFKMGFAKKQLFYMISKNSRKFTQNGRIWTGYSYYVKEAWQGNCGKIHVIGDKAGLESTHILKTTPNLIFDLENSIQIPVKIIYVKRNPFDVITTKARQGNKVLRPVNCSILENAMDIHQNMLGTIAGLRQIYKQKLLEFRHEDFIDNPELHLKKICNFLGLECHAQYLESCKQIVFKKPHFSRFDVEWPNSLIQKTESIIANHDFLEGYTYQK